MSSLDRLDVLEFPPLNLANQMAKSQLPVIESSSSGDRVSVHHNRLLKFMKLPTDERLQLLNKKPEIETARDFINCRVGLRLSDYHQNLEKVLMNYKIGEYGDFINVFIEPIRSGIHENEFELIPDLVLSHSIWTKRVCLELKFPSAEILTPNAIRRFEQVFLHALYLPALVIVIQIPNSEQAHAAVAAIVNQSIHRTSRHVLVLFKVFLSQDNHLEVSDSGLGVGDRIDICDGHNHTDDDSPFREHDYENELTQQDKSPVKEDFATKCNFCKTVPKSSTGTSSDTRWSPISGLVDWQSRQPVEPILTVWQQWNSISSHLSDDSRFGVCLSIDDDLTDNEELERWAGAPVRMIIVNVNRFSRQNGTIALEPLCKTFISNITRANSLMTNIVLDGVIGENVREYLLYLDYLTFKFKTKKQDPLSYWNDRCQPPLQPLSHNLDASTYGVFEMDATKYLKYREAMVEALKQVNHDLNLQNVTKRDIVLMVLGAGRGPLVDCFIDAIKSVKTCLSYKIYALDKNASSVRSLKYKLHNYWSDRKELYRVEVVESDMRVWEPKEKADVIATELLGSFSDNELSPECLDGTWRFATSETISIPQEYSSYIAPIYSCRLRQRLGKLKVTDENVYDKIYVDKLVNYYLISDPQELFNFEHKDLSRIPIAGQNERYKKLTFTSKVDITCHGFAGYFRAHLYGSVEISTLYNHSTPHMHSWFQAVVPIENPIEMPAGANLDIHFWRKESPTSVWYQWTVTHPQRSRPHSGEKTAMSKFI